MMQANAAAADYAAYRQLCINYLRYAERPGGDRLMLRRMAKRYAALATQAKRKGRYLIGLERLREARGNAWQG